MFSFNFNGLSNDCLTAAVLGPISTSATNSDSCIGSMNSESKLFKIIGALRPAVLAFGVVLSLAWSALLVWLVLRVFHVA